MMVFRIQQNEVQSKCKEAFLPPSTGKLSKAQGVVMAKCIQEASSGHGYIDMEWKSIYQPGKIYQPLLFYCFKMASAPGFDLVT